MKPWERYQDQPSSQSKPWERYSAAPESVPEPQDNERSLIQSIGDLAAGAVRGAGSIGATALAPYDMVVDAMGGKGLSLESNRERRAAMDDALRLAGADTQSLPYKGGKLAAEVAGTAGAGGVLAKGAAASGAAPKVVSALQSGGFSLGSPASATRVGRAADAGIRAAAGGAGGATAAGMVNPEDIDEGALIGAAMPGGVQAAGKVGSAIRKATGSMLTNVLGRMTGAGEDALKVAFEAGKQGSQDFLDNMRGDVGFDQVVDSARDALSSMRLQRQAAYRAGMADISKDKTVLDFAPLDDAMKIITGAGKYKGVQIRRKAAETSDELRDLMSQWRDLDPAEFHTPEGFDALKQAVGDIRDSTQHGTNARRITDELYRAVRSQIDRQAPAYSKVMKDYQEASDTLKELERTFSLGDKAKTARDTSLRKFQSLMRNNAQTSYGNRLDSAEKLRQGGADVLPAVAGQALSGWTPRGMTGAIQMGGIPAASVLAGNPAPMMMLPLSSPRVAGESAYALGRGLARGGDAMSPATSQIMRMLNAPAGSAIARTTPLLTLLSSQEDQR